MASDLLPEAIEAAAKAAQYVPLHDFISPDKSQDGQEHLGWSDAKHVVEAAAPAIRAQDQARIKELEAERNEYRQAARAEAQLYDNEVAANQTTEASVKPTQPKGGDDDE